MGHRAVIHPETNQEALRCLKARRVTNHNFVMRRFLFRSLGLLFTAAIVFFCFLWFAFSGWIIEGDKQPFKRSYALSRGVRVVVSGAESSDFQGDYSARYTLSLHGLGKKPEIVAHGYIFNEELPAGPFRLQGEGKFLFLTDGQAVFVRPRRGGAWFKHALRDDRNLAFWGRAIMPDRYAHNEKFGNESGPSRDGSENRLPSLPPLVFERWNLKKRLVVLRVTSPAPSEANWHDQTRFLWPRRLIFENWKFSAQKPLALEPKWKLRRFPRDVKVEIQALDFADALDVPLSATRNDPAKLPGARSMWQKTVALSASTSALPLQRWWNQKGPTTLQIRGWCADPNPQLLHFQWRVGQGEWFWTIAHRGQSVPLREPNGGALEAPYLYARFRWPERKMKRT